MLTVAGTPVHPIGLGGRHIGGAYSKPVGGIALPKTQVDPAREIAGIKHNIDLGVNYIDVCHHYGYGKSLELIATALQGYDREKLFINAKLEIHYASVNEVMTSLYRYCSALKTDYIDSYQLHGVMQHLDHHAVIDIINDLIKTKQVRHLSVSNLNKEQLANILKWSNYGLLTNEINYNLVMRVNEENGVIDRCTANNVQIIAYKPLKRNEIATANYPLLHQLTEKYRRTENQILLNRLCKHKKYQVLCKSTNPIHIDENMSSLDFQMKPERYAALDAFRPDGYTTPEYDYRGDDDSKPKIWKL